MTKLSIKLLQLILLIGLTKQCVCLDNVFLKIPDRPVYVGDDVTIECHYNLEEDTLNSITWYKDDQIFMRYAPKERKPMTGFPTDGVNMLKESLRPTSITLKKVVTESAGYYGCEVLTEAPSFQRQKMSAHLTVHSRNGEDYSDLDEHVRQHRQFHHSSSATAILMNLRLIEVGVAILFIMLWR